MMKKQIVKIITQHKEGMLLAHEATLAIIKHCQDHPEITSLDLWANSIGAEGAGLIAKALVNPNCTLTSLNLWYNKLGVEAKRLIQQGLSHSRQRWGERLFLVAQVCRQHNVSTDIVKMILRVTAPANYLTSTTFAGRIASFKNLTFRTLLTHKKSYPVLWWPPPSGQRTVFFKI